MDKNVFYHFMYFMYLKNKKVTFQKGKHREERCEELTPQYPTQPDPTRSTNRIRDVVLSFMNPDTIHFLNKTHFKYLFVKDNVDPQFCPSTLTFYPMDVTLTYRSHMTPLGPYLTLVGF